VTRLARSEVRRAAGLPLALDRILALGERASRYTEAGLARRVGVSRERIRQLKVAGVLPHKPMNSREDVAPGYDWHTAQAFQSAMWHGIDKFVALVDARRDDECWLWAGYKSNLGYGVLRIKSRTRFAHRIAWEREHGPIPKGMNVVHRKGGIPCCNPRHLCLETPRERVYRWRRSVQQGACAGRMSGDLRAMTPAKARAIRRAYTRLPKVPVRQRNGRAYERTKLGCLKKLARRFGIKDLHLLASLTSGRTGLWIGAG
jgi:hypothetical protein